VRESLAYWLALVGQVKAAGVENESITATIQSLLEEAQAQGVDIQTLAAEMSTMPPRRLQSLLSVESVMEDLQIIEKSAVTILTIKEDLIGPARQRTAAAVSLKEMLSEMIANMGLPHGVVEIELADELPDAFCDARQVEQVFNNLVKNAWEALHEQDAPRIAVQARRDDNPQFVLVSVRDNGPGIPQEIQEKIWVSFFTTKGGRGGTGLGLSACVQIVNQNGGRIWLESKPGRGAAFFVLLPVAENFKSKEAQ
jgi:signal transduction histidine kinase